MTTRQTGLSVPGPAAAGHAGVLIVGAGISGIDRAGTSHRHKSAEWGYIWLPEPEEVSTYHGLVIVERDLHWTPVKFGEIAARF
jgi:hypothetical protein